MHSPQKQVRHFQKNWKKEARRVTDVRADPPPCQNVYTHAYSPLRVARLQANGEPRGAGGQLRITHESPFRTAPLT